MESIEVADFVIHLERSPLKVVRFSNALVKFVTLDKSQSDIFPYSKFTQFPSSGAVVRHSSIADSNKASVIGVKGGGGEGGGEGGGDGGGEGGGEGSGGGEGGGGDGGGGKGAGGGIGGGRGGGEGQGGEGKEGGGGGGGDGGGDGDEGLLRGT